MRLKTTRSLVLLLTALNLFNYIDRFVFAAILPPIQRELHLNDLQGGILISAFVVVYSLVSPFFGMLGDRSYRVPVLASAGLVWCLSTGMTGTALGFASLLFWRAMIGVGEAAFGSIGPALIDERAESGRKSRIIGFFYLAIYLGAALGYILGGQLNSQIGWRRAFLVTGFAGLPLALLAYRIEDRRPRRDEAVFNFEQFWKVQKTLLTNRLFLFTVLGYCAWNFVIPAFSAWAPTFLEREMHLDLAAGNFKLGALTVVMGLLGTLAGSFWSDHWVKREERAPLWVGAISTIPAVLSLVFAFTTRDPATFWILCGCSLFLTSMSMGPCNAMILESVPETMRASGMALSIFMIHWLGDVFSPTLVGWWSDHHGLRNALLGLPAALALTPILWFFAAGYIPRAAVAKTTSENTRQ